MYTFNPIADVPVDHLGFAFIVVVCIVTVLISVCNAWEDERLATFLVTSVGAIAVGLFAYCVSYVWTDQNPKTYANVQVTGEFVEFVAEGYNIAVSSGKTTRHVDRHETYVVYKVNGELVMLKSELGVTYPKTAILYKN